MSWGAVPEAERGTRCGPEHRPPHRGVGTRIAGGIAGTVVSSLLLGVGSAWAYWTAQATVVGTVAPRPVGMELAHENLDLVITNAEDSRTRTGTVTVRNLGADPGTVIAGTYSAEPLAAHIPVSIWSQSVAECGVEEIPAGAGRGTWATAVAPEVPPVPGNGSVVFCVRTHLSTADAGRLAHETGTLTTSSAFAAILTPSGWGQLSEYRRVAFTTRGILPAPEEPWMPEGQSRFYTMRPEGDRNLCLTTGTGIILGATLAIENCVPRSLQAFDLVPSTSDGHRLVALRSLYNTRLMVTVGAGGKLTLESGGSIAVNPRAQQWWVQNRPGGMMQFVSALDGRCLVVPPVKTSEALTTGPCESSPVSVEPRRMPMAWQGSGSTVRFELGFHPVSKTYILQSRKTGQTAWVDRKRISLADRTLEWSMGLLDTGDYDLRIVDHTGLLVYDGLSVSRPSGQDVRPVTGFG